jgi:hypothetical protein
MDQSVLTSAVMLPKHQKLGKILSELAVMAYVNASALGMSKLDRTASFESDVHHDAKQGISRVNVTTLPGAEPHINAIKAKQRQARQLLVYYTTPWGGDRRLLPNVLINDFIEAFEVVLTEHDQLVQEFHKAAPRLIAKAYDNLGKYSVSPPSLDKVMGAFRLGYEMVPIPRVEQYSSSKMMDEMQRMLSERYEADMEAAYHAAQKDALLRIWEPLGHLIERMDAYDEREKRKEDGEEVDKVGTFKSTVITNITDMAKVFRSFNLVNDPFITRIADRLDAFEGVDHTALVKSADQRRATAKEAAEIRQMLEGML